MYISIASYRDPMLQSTIDSAFKNADHPEDLTIGCFISVISSKPNLEKHLISNTYNGKVIFEIEEAGQIFSVTRARNKASQWLKKEDEYLLQIDSHTRFLPGWDTEIIESYKRLNKENAIFSTYIPSWFPTNNGEHYRDWDLFSVQFAEYAEKSKECLFDTYEIVPDLPPKHNPAKSFYRTWHLSGMFQFSIAEYYINLPQPEWICFWGEELYNSCRAFTNGWDVYCPDVMPFRQMYPQDLTTEMKIKYFDDPEGPNKNWRDFGNFWQESKIKSTDLIIDSLIENKIGPEHFGFKRNIQDLYSFIGYNLADRYKGWRDEYRKIH